MKFLLHTCCAPCVLPIIERLKEEKDLEISLYFFNPNIYPDEEYDRRLEAVRKVAKIYNLPLFVENPGFKTWNEEISAVLPNPPESYPENGDRCSACLSYRLENTADYAAKNGFGAFGTTLSVSLWKNVKAINSLGIELEKENNLVFRDFSEIDPLVARNEEKLLSKKHGIYCQKYCGCKYSIKDLSSK